MDLTIPPLPDTQAAMLRILSRDTPSPDSRRLVEIVQRDPVTTAYVLRRANSSKYGVYRYIIEVEKAVRFLGFRDVSDVVLTASLNQSYTYLEAPEAQRIYNHLIKTSLATAALSKEFVTHMNLPGSDLAYTAGLIHQLGRFGLLSKAPDRYIDLWYETAAPDAIAVPTPQREQAVMGTDYLQWGQAISEAWELPEELSTILANLLTPGAVREPFLLVMTLIIAVSGATAEAFFAHDDEDQPAASIAHYAPLLELAWALSWVLNKQMDELFGFLEARREKIRRYVGQMLAA